jgi:hypothetical protein
LGLFHMRRLDVDADSGTNVCYEFTRFFPILP